jgi:hypothetical protein
VRLAPSARGDFASSPIFLIEISRPDKFFGGKLELYWTLSSGQNKKDNSS